MKKENFKLAEKLYDEIKNTNTTIHYLNEMIEHGMDFRICYYTDESKQFSNNRPYNIGLDYEDIKKIKIILENKYKMLIQENERKIAEI